MSSPASPSIAASAMVHSRGGVRLSVRLTPKASSDRILGVAVDAAGRPALKAAVAAPPEDGKANAALLKLLAKALGLPRSTLAVVSGAAHRNKVVAIEGDPAELARRFESMLGGSKWARS